MILQRIAAAVRYDGARYHGWQRQEAEVLTIQQCVERAFSRVADHEVSVVCAGRTDAGVHASGQVVHFETSANRDERSWIFGANSNLPGDISIAFAKTVVPAFHARFSATARTYRYVMLNQPVRPAILRHAVGWHYKPLDVGKMKAAAKHLIGEHDFNAYRGSGCQAKHPIRTIHRLDIYQQGRLIVFEVKANAFLLHMVRNIVGVLVSIGEGGKPPSWAKTVLESQDRTQGGVTIAPNGLYLISVDYPSHFALPEIPTGPFFLG